MAPRLSAKQLHGDVGSSICLHLRGAKHIEVACRGLGSTNLKHLHVHAHREKGNGTRRLC
jgi:hypothetical protein